MVPESKFKKVPERTSFPEMVDNPFFEARNSAHKTQVEVAEMCEVRAEFIMRLEQGLMRSVPERVVNVYRRTMDLPEGWMHQYKRFQSIKRREATRPTPPLLPGNRPGEVTLPDGPGPLTFDKWRVHNWPTLSRSRWCKEFCIHPATLYTLEDGGQSKFPHEVRCALLDSGFITVAQVEELVNRIWMDRAKYSVAG